MLTFPLLVYLAGIPYTYLVSDRYEQLDRPVLLLIWPYFIFYDLAHPQHLKE